MKRCGIIAPAGREESAAAALKVHAWMRDRAIDVFCEGFLHDLLPDTGLLRRGVSVDAIVALGGDGTILRSVPYAAGREVPVLGINLGNKGCLAAAESDRLEEALEALLSGEAACDRRRLIHINGDDSLLALNDVGILRGGRQRLMSVRVSVDGEKVGVYRCDGILVATPTGSTGYALSAGGPIVMPGAACLEIVPVCAHCLQTRPIVVPETSTVTFEMMDDPEMEGMLQLDGKTIDTVRAGRTVDISFSDLKLSLIRMGQTGYFDIVNRKLTEWSI